MNLKKGYISMRINDNACGRAMSVMSYNAIHNTSTTN